MPVSDADERGELVLRRARVYLDGKELMLDRSGAVVGE